MPDYSDLLPDIPPEQANQLILDQLKNKPSPVPETVTNKTSAIQDLAPYALGPILGGAALKAIVPLAAALRIPRTNNKIYSDNLIYSHGDERDKFVQEALKNSKARVSPEGVQINVHRYQDPNQADKDALSGGVFYTPSSQAMNSIYKGNNPRYGGSQVIKGTTLLRNPFYTYNDEGWFSDAAKSLLGDPDRFDIENEIFNNISNSKYNGNIPEALKAVSAFRRKWSPESPDIPPEVFTGEKGSYQYWLNQAAVAHKARQMGYDSILPLGYSGTGRPKIDEIFDLRESHFPTPEGGYRLWPQYQSDELKK